MPQVPRLNPIEQAPSSTMISPVNPPLESVADVTGPQRQAAGNLATQVAAFSEKQMQLSADTAAKDVVNKFEAEFNRQFYVGDREAGVTALRHRTGPEGFGKGVEDLKTSMRQYRESIIPADADPYTKNLINQYLQKSDAKIQSTLTDYVSKTSGDWDRSVASSRNELLQRSAVLSVGKFDGSARSLRDFEDNIRDLEQNILDLAIKEGRSGTDDITVNQIAKARSQTVYNAINNVAATPGMAGRAKQLYDLYQDDLDAVNKPALKAKIEKEAADLGATQKLEQLLSDPKATETSILQKINSIGNSETKSLVKNKFYDMIKRDQQTKEIISTQLYDRLYTPIASVMNSNTPYVSVSDMLEKNPALKESWDSLTPKYKESFTELIESPTSDNPIVVSKMNGFIKNGTLRNLSESQLAAEMAGLSKSTKDFYVKAHRQEQGIIPDPQRQSSIQGMFDMLDDVLRADGGPLPKKGQKLTKKQQTIENNVQSSLSSVLYSLNSFPAKNSPEAYKIVGEFYKLAVQQNLTLPEIEKGVADKIGKRNSIGGNDRKQLVPSNENAQARRKYIGKYGEPPMWEDQLEDFLQGKEPRPK